MVGVPDQLALCPDKVPVALRLALPEQLKVTEGAGVQVAVSVAERETVLAVGERVRVTELKVAVSWDSVGVPEWEVDTLALLVRLGSSLKLLEGVGLLEKVKDPGEGDHVRVADGLRVVEWLGEVEMDGDQLRLCTGERVWVRDAVVVRVAVGEREGLPDREDVADGLREAVTLLPVRLRVDVWLGLRDCVLDPVAEPVEEWVDMVAERLQVTVGEWERLGTELSVPV